MTLSALGFITKESISNKEEKFSKVIPVAVFYELPRYQLANIKLPYSHNLAMCIQEIKHSDLPKEDNIDINFASEKYFDALQYVVVETIFSRFSRSWNVSAKRIQTPNGEQVSWQNIEEKGKEIAIEDFFGNASDNYFVKLGLLSNLADPFGGKAVFPPATKIEIYKPSSHEFVMTFTTDYLSLKIKLAHSSSSVGLGEYSRMLQSKIGTYGHSVFLLETDIEQKYLLNGHPEMKKHRNWANSIVELLDTTFNFELIRENHMRQFQLYGAEGVVRR